jgi:hypothetical protein
VAYFGRYPPLLLFVPLRLKRSFYLGLPEEYRNIVRSSCTIPFRWLSSPAAETDP